MAWHYLLILFFTAVLGGAVNAVAGGGTLLTFPALIMVGQAAIVANATNTVALWPGALSSYWGYRSELGYHRREVLFLSVPSFLGGVLGAWLLVNTDESTFDILVPYLILLATGLFIVQEPLARWQQRRAEPSGEDKLPNTESAVAAAFGHSATPLRWGAVLLSQFLIGVYGGYFGAGIGILMLAAYGILGFSNIHQANAIKNLNSMFINGIAAAIFICKGLIDWQIALLMAAGAIFGGYAGAGTARRLGQKNVRRLVIFIGLALATKMLLKL
ncbi:MAG: sulfite exporter TauE/SafE family protein [Thermoguttaceae bacterium]